MGMAKIYGKKPKKKEQSVGKDELRLEWMGTGTDLTFEQWKRGESEPSFEKKKGKLKMG